MGFDSEKAATALAEAGFALDGAMEILLAPPHQATQATPFAAGGVAIIDDSDDEVLSTLPSAAASPIDTAVPQPTPGECFGFDSRVPWCLADEFLLFAQDSTRSCSSEAHAPSPALASAGVATIEQSEGVAVGSATTQSLSLIMPMTGVAAPRAVEGEESPKKKPRRHDLRMPPTPLRGVAAPSLEAASVSAPPTRMFASRAFDAVKGGNSEELFIGTAVYEGRLSQGAELLRRPDLALPSFFKSQNGVFEVMSDPVFPDAVGKIVYVQKKDLQTLLSVSDAAELSTPVSDAMQTPNAKPKGHLRWPESTHSTMTPPAGNKTPSAGTMTPPACFTTPPARTMTSPAGIMTPPARTMTPPAGIMTPAAGTPVSTASATGLAFVSPGTQVIINDVHSILSNVPQAVPAAEMLQESAPALMQKDTDKVTELRRKLARCLDRNMPEEHPICRRFNQQIAAAERDSLTSKVAEVRPTGSF